MTCIVLDMEWSQPVTKENTARMNGKPLPVEIIQIGAVILKNGEIADKFSKYVKPRVYTRIKPKIRRLTGIGQQDLKDAEEFPEVMNQLRKWIEPYSPDYTVTWGCNDIPLLDAQCEAYLYDISWLPESCDLQRIYTHMRDLDKTQISLSLAIQAEDIKEDVKFHSAINDAYYTAMVLKIVDKLPERIEWQRRVNKTAANPIVDCCAYHYGKMEGAFTIEALKTEPFLFTVCPHCGSIVCLELLKRIDNNVFCRTAECDNHTVGMKITVIENADKSGWSYILETSIQKSPKDFYALLRGENTPWRGKRTVKQK